MVEHNEGENEEVKGESGFVDPAEIKDVAPYNNEKIDHEPEWKDFLAKVEALGPRQACYFQGTAKNAERYKVKMKKVIKKRKLPLHMAQRTKNGVMRVYVFDKDLAFVDGKLAFIKK